MGRGLVGVDLRCRIFCLRITIFFLERPWLGDALILKQILAKYERSSGQCVNFKKSSILFNSNIDGSVMDSIVTFLGV